MSDKLRKYKSLYSSTCNTFSTGEGVTITPASVTGLPTDTEITLTFDRVDSSGTKTPSKMERIRGTVIGGNFVISSGGRAVEGTEQVHTSPVVEMIWNADDWNDTVDHILTEHNQDGTHKDTLVTSLKASGADVNTGTSDVTIVTPKAIADSYLGGATSNLQTQINSKVQNDGWIYANETWTYVSSTTFTVSGDVTSKYQITDLIKLTQTTVKYFEISAISYASGTGLTTITVKGIGTYTLASAAITSNYYQHKFPIGLVRTKSLVRAYNNAALSIATATETQIPFNTESFDTNSEYDTSTYTFTAKKAGYYLVNVSIIYVEGAIPRASLAMRLNGNYNKSTASAITADYSGINFSDIIYLAVNDALTFYTTQNSGVNKTIQVDQGSSYVSIAEL